MLVDRDDCASVSSGVALFLTFSMNRFSSSIYAFLYSRLRRSDPSCRLTWSENIFFLYLSCIHFYFSSQPTAEERLCWWVKMAFNGRPSTSPRVAICWRSCRVWRTACCLTANSTRRYGPREVKVCMVLLYSGAHVKKFQRISVTK